MDNVRTIYLDWNTGGIVRSDSGAYLARQYDHLSNLIVFRNAPGLENYYLIVEMKEGEDDIAARSMEPIMLPGPYWLVPNVYTQLVQPVTFQVCCKTEYGDFEQHSAKFMLNVIESLNHDGADLDVDPSPLFDAYKDYVDDRVEEIVAAAGDVVIDAGLIISGAAADAKATGDAISETNERLDQLEQSCDSFLDLSDLTLSAQTASEEGYSTLTLSDDNGNSKSVNIPVNTLSDAHTTYIDTLVQTYLQSLVSDGDEGGY